MYIHAACTHPTPTRRVRLQEILRLGHKTCLHYPLYPPYADKSLLSNHTLVCSLNEMVPVRARRQIVYPLERLGENAPGMRVLKQQQPYALNHLNRKLTLEPKVSSLMYMICS